MASYMDDNGNPIVITYDQMMQRAYDSRAGAFRALTGGSGAQAVTPSDANDLPKGTCKGLYVGTAGDVAVQMADKSQVTLKGLAAGVVHSIAVRRVLSTGTTATDIVAFY